MQDNQSGYEEKKLCLVREKRNFVVHENTNEILIFLETKNMSNNGLAILITIIKEYTLYLSPRVCHWHILWVGGSPERCISGSELKQLCLVQCYFFCKYNWICDCTSSPKGNVITNCTNSIFIAGETRAWVFFFALNTFTMSLLVAV